MERYTARNAMSAEKTVAVSFRVSPRFKKLLEAAAALEHRSQTNMLETLVFGYCEQHAIELPTLAASPPREIAPLKTSKGRA